MKKCIIGALLLPVIFSCSNEHSVEMAFSDQVALSLNGNTPGVVITKAIVDLPASTQVGVYVLETNPTVATFDDTPLKNILYTATGVDSSFTSAAPAMLDRKKEYKVCAYGPRLEIAPIDSAAVPFVHGDDVIFAPSALVTIDGSTASAHLEFVHKMSQIKFTLKSGNGTPDIAGATLHVTGFHESCTLNLSNGDVNPVTGVGATLTDIDKSVCFVPGNLVLDITVTTLDGKVFRGTINRTFDPSFSYTYTLTVDKSDTELQISGRIVDWTIVDGGDVSVQG